MEDTKKPVVFSPALSTDSETSTPESQQDKECLNLFLQKPGSFSKLSKLLEVAKMAHDSEINPNPSQVLTTTALHPSCPSPQAALTQQEVIDKTETSALKSRHESIFQDDQLCKVLTEKSNQWFSLLPRSPCDESSVTSGSSPLRASSPLQANGNKSPSSLSDPVASDSSSAPAGINNMQSSTLQVGG